MEEDAELAVSDNQSERRYELRRGDEVLGTIDYRADPDALLLLHTEVDPAFEGHGYGSRLVSGALDDIRARGLSVVPVCRFVSSYLRRHPEHADLVTER